MNKSIRSNNALGRLKSGEMNKTEVAYKYHLEALKSVGDIEWYVFESVTVKLANNTRYTPDFCVMRKGGQLEMHEVKGFWRDDARVKIKVAADKFPFVFVAVKKRSKKDSVALGGDWEYEYF